MIARAPGKLMLAGEYAVLHGGPALVMAVDRHAVARTRAPEGVGGPLAPEVATALSLARREGWLTGAHEDVEVDVTALASGGVKLGLGGSAAGCVAALGLCLARERRAMDPLAVGLLARRGHRAAQGGGSGVDVLASALGGVVRVEMPSGLEGEVSVEARSWPGSIPWMVLWTGTPARTSEMILRVEALRAREPSYVERCFEGIAAACRGLDRALVEGDARAAVEAVASHGRWMKDLGERSGAGVVTEALSRLAGAVEPFGAAVKPSGAGGGDVALVVAQDDLGLDRAASEARARGFTRVEVAMEPRGLRVEERG